MVSTPEDPITLGIEDAVIALDYVVDLLLVVGEDEKAAEIRQVETVLNDVYNRWTLAMEVRPSS